MSTIWNSCPGLKRITFFIWCVSESEVYTLLALSSLSVKYLCISSRLPGHDAHPAVFFKNLADLEACCLHTLDDIITAFHNTTARKEHHTEYPLLKWIIDHMVAGLGKAI